MAERADPRDPGFRDKYFGLVKSPYKRRLFERYEFCNKYVKNKVVVDIPCGVGWGTSLLKGAVSVAGFDISTEAVEYAKLHYGNNKRKFYQGTMQTVNLSDGSVDVVICLEGFEHVSKEEGGKFIVESKRILKPEGILIMTCPILSDSGKSTGNPYHVYEYPYQELIEIYNQNFKIRSLEMVQGPDGPEYRAVLCKVDMCQQ